MAELKPWEKYARPEAKKPWERFQEDTLQDRLTGMGIPEGMGVEEFLASRPAAQPTAFPQEPGESRAAQELPETFLPGSGVGETLPAGEAAGVTAAAMTMTDPSEIASMLQQFPEIGIQYAPDGTIIAANNETGAKSVINRPGITGMDVLQTLGIGAAFTPAGRLAAVPGSVTGRVAVGALGAGATEEVIQRGQEAAGGERDAVDVAISAALGPLAELGAPLVKGATAAKDFMGSFVGEGMEKLLPEATAAALKFAKEAKGRLRSAREAIVSTGDALSETLTPGRQEFLKRAERMPLTGTGPIKVRQAQERVELLEDIAAQYEVDPNTSYGKSVLDDLTATRKKRLDEGLTARKSAETTLADAGTVRSPLAEGEIDDIILQEEAKGALANDALIKRLNKIKLDLTGGARDFAGMRQYRSTVWKGVPFDELYSKDINAALKRVGNALSRDMRFFANEHSAEAAENWAKYNKIFRDDLANVKDSQLGKLLKSAKTDVDLDLVDRVLDSNKPKFLRQLYGRMGAPGQKAMRSRLLQDMLTEAGWPNPKKIDPKQFRKLMDSKKYRGKLEAFFPGDTHGRQLSGFKEYLRLTEGAQAAGEGIGMAAAQPMTMTEQLRRITGVTGILARIHESAPARNLLLRLHHSQGDQRATDRIMKQLRPLIMTAGRQIMTSEEPEDVKQETPVDLMNQLRSNVAGAIAPNENPEARLNEMLNQ